MTEDLCGPRHASFFKPGFFLILLDLFGIGLDGGEFERVFGTKVRVDLDKGTLISQMVDALEGAHDEVIRTFRANKEIFFEGFVEHDRLAAWTFRPKTGRHAFLSEAFCDQERGRLRH